MKRLLYGAIPYYLTKIFSSHSPSLKYYKYIKDHKYSRHLYEFREEYDDMEVHIQMDESRGLHYVLKDGKRLYFRRNTPLDKIQGIIGNLSWNKINVPLIIIWKV